MQRPIGWFLERGDALLTERMDRALTDNGMTRREWQLLNGADGSQEQRDQLVARGWLEPDGSRTAAGERARARAQATVETFRRRAMEGVSEEDYAATIRTLERLVANLSEP